MSIFDMGKNSEKYTFKFNSGFKSEDKRREVADFLGKYQWDPPPDYAKMKNAMMDELWRDCLNEAFKTSTTSAYDHGWWWDDSTMHNGHRAGKSTAYNHSKKVNFLVENFGFSREQAVTLMQYCGDNTGELRHLAFRFKKGGISFYDLLNQRVGNTNTQKRITQPKEST